MDMFHRRDSCSQSHAIIVNMSRPLLILLCCCLSNRATAGRWHRNKRVKAQEDDAGGGDNEQQEQEDEEEEDQPEDSYSYEEATGPVTFRGCPKPPRFSSFQADGTVRIECGSKKAAWAAWPQHAMPRGGFAWQPLLRGDTPPRVDSDFVVTRCGKDENWLQRVVARPSVLSRAASASSVPRAGRPDVVFVFVDSVSHDAFQTRFPKTTKMLAQLNASGAAARTSTHRSFSRSHSLPCCTKNWMYAALAGVYAPAKNAVHEPQLARGASWVWDEFARAGYVTHVGNDMCYPSELQDWWRAEDSPLLVNVSDHPMLDVFCKRKPERSSDGASFFQTRWDGVQYETPMDEGESICVAGETLARRWFDQALALLRAPAYRHAPKFTFTALNDVHCKCTSGPQHMDVELERFLKDLAPSLAHTVLILASDHGVLDSWENLAPDLHHPFLSVMLPTSLTSHLPPSSAAALTTNERRLLTPFDLHATLRHLIHIGAPDSSRFIDPAREPSPSSNSLWARYKQARRVYAACIAITPHASPLRRMHRRMYAACIAVCTPHTSPLPVAIVVGESFACALCF